MHALQVFVKLNFYLKNNFKCSRYLSKWIFLLPCLHLTLVFCSLKVKIIHDFPQSYVRYLNSAKFYLFHLPTQKFYRLDTYLFTQEIPLSPTSNDTVKTSYCILGFGPQHSVVVPTYLILFYILPSAAYSIMSFGLNYLIRRTKR